jgi:putative heme degradation protein
MGEDFYSIIKLISGEELLSLVMVDENDGDPIIVLQNPVIMKVHSGPTGTYVKVKPWIELSDDDFFMIKLDKVITMTETKDKKLIDLYNHYLSDGDSIELYKPSGEVKVSDRMGYISSVEDARKKLEELYKGIKES